jgi:hypothetical protein
MFRSIRTLTIGVAILTIVSGLGCSNKDEAKPNSGLTTPDIPPGRGQEGKGGALTNPAKKP